MPAATPQPASIQVAQLDHAGHYIGPATAWASPLDPPGTYLLPAGTVQEPPPAEWPAGRWPRWSGTAWELVAKPAHINAAPPAVDCAAEPQPHGM